VSNFEDAVPTVVNVYGREVVVIGWKGEFFALRNICPHQSQSFVRGKVCYDLVGTPNGELALSEPVLVCPWHNWPYDLRTGKCTVDPTKRVRTFEVRVDEGRVMIRADKSRKTSEDRESDHA
jgi:nitrite reductase/ring-hydroxylating ferredoxin subunit